MKLSRRTLLHGAGGAALGLPLLEAMLNSHGTALAQGQPLPKRFVVWFFGNGVILPRWVPAATGASWAVSEELKPLQDAGIDVKSYVSVVSGYNLKTPNLRGHHNGVAAMLSGAPFTPIDPGTASYASKFSTKSIDQIAADTIGATSKFKSLQLAVSKRYTTGEGSTLRYLSHRGPDQPLPQVTSPATLFNTLFSSFTPPNTQDPKDQLRVSVLDAVNEDTRRLQAKLGTADRQRLDAHLTSVAELRTRILAAPTAVTSTCTRPATVTNTNADINGVEQYETVSKLMSDLLAMAFACDLTRVATYQFSGSVGGHVFRSLSPSTEARNNEHSLTHDAAQQNKVHDAVVFTMKNFAYTLNKLKGTVEGAGNLLDNSCVLCTTDVAQGIDHSINNYPILVAGRAGGALKYPGIHLKGTGQNTTDVLYSCLKAVGTGATSAGAAEGYSTTAAPILT